MEIVALRGHTPTTIRVSLGIRTFDEALETALFCIWHLGNRPGLSGRVNPVERIDDLPSPAIRECQGLRIRPLTVKALATVLEWRGLTAESRSDSANKGLTEQPDWR